MKERLENFANLHIDADSQYNEELCDESTRNQEVGEVDNEFNIEERNHLIATNSKILSGSQYNTFEC